MVSSIIAYTKQLQVIKIYRETKSIVALDFKVQIPIYRMFV